MNLKTIEIDKLMKEVGMNSLHCGLCGDRTHAMVYLDYTVHRFNRDQNKYEAKRHGKCYVHEQCLKSYLR